MEVDGLVVDAAVTGLCDGEDDMLAAAAGVPLA